MLSLARCTPVHRPFSSARQAPPQKAVVAKAYVEASTTFAVLQQSIAFAVVAGGEAIYARSRTSEGQPGRPDILPVAGGAAGCLASAFILSSGNESLLTPALITGVLSSGFLLAYTVKRTIETVPTADDTDWPGPKSWPGTMALICFFELCVYLQALRAEV